MKAPRIKCWSNNYLVEFVASSPDTGADVGMIAEKKYLELVKSGESDFKFIPEKVNASGANNATIEVVGAVLMPLVFDAIRDQGLWYPDLCCQSNRFFMKFYIVKNLNCDLILAWRDLLWLGFQVVLTQHCATISNNIVIHKYDSEQPTKLLQHTHLSNNCETNQKMKTVCDFSQQFDSNTCENIQPIVVQTTSVQHKIGGGEPTVVLRDKKVEPSSRGYGKDLFLKRKQHSPLENEKMCYTLASKWYKRLKAELSFTPNLDGAATFKNRKCVKYISKYPETASFHTNFFNTPYQKLRGYKVFVNPPFGEMDEWVSAILTNRLDCVLVAPDWPSFYWFYLLNKLSKKKFLLPTSTIKNIFQDGDKGMPRLSYDCHAYRITKTDIDKFVNDQGNTELLSYLPSFERVARKTVTTVNQVVSSDCAPTHNPRKSSVYINQVSDQQLDCLLRDFEKAEHIKLEHTLDEYCAQNNLITMDGDDTKELDHHDLYFCGFDDSTEKIQLVFSSDPNHKTFKFASDFEPKTPTVSVHGVQNQNEQKYLPSKEVWEHLEDSISDLNMDADPTKNFEHEDPKIVEIVKRKRLAFIPRDYDPSVERCGGFMHKIFLKQEARIHTTKPYRMSPLEKEALQQYLDLYLKRKWISKSNSPWASATFLVPKKTYSIDGKKELRLVIDYRALNNATIRDIFPMKSAAELFGTLQGSEWFSSLDFESGYHQMALDPDSRALAAFITPFGLFEPNVTVFGLHSAPASFQRMMEGNFQDFMQRREVAIYLDDMLVHNKNTTDHYKLLEKIMDKVIDLKMTLNLRKCMFLKKKLEYLGHIVSKDKVSMDPQKVDSILRYSRPTTTKQLQRFVGMITYYSPFIRGFQSLAKPLYDLLKGHMYKNAKIVMEEDVSSNVKEFNKSMHSNMKTINRGIELNINFSTINEDTIFGTSEGFYVDKQLMHEIVNSTYTPIERVAAKKEDERKGDSNTGFMKKGKKEKMPKLTTCSPTWNLECEVAFESLKKALANAPCLCIPNEWEPFQLWTDASDTALGGILEQNGQPVAFFSKNLTDFQALSYSTYQKEAMSLVSCLRRWRCFLDNGQQHTIYCDNDSLCKILTQKTNLDKFQVKIIHLIGGMNITFVHVPSEEQRSDPMTRQHDVNVVTRGQTKGIVPEPFSKSKGEAEHEEKATLWRESYDNDCDLSPIISVLQGRCVVNIDKKGIKEQYKYQGGLLLYKVKNSWKIVVPRDLKATITELAHDLSGHYGVEKTIQNLVNYYWKGMVQEIKWYVRSCHVCCCSKHQLHKNYGVPEPLIHPTEPRRRIHLDTISGLPEVDGFAEVLTVIDAFSRYALAIPIKKSTDAKEFARIFHTHIVPVFGMVPTVVSDNAKLFTSEFTRYSMAALGTDLKTTVAYHPEGNMVERFHRDINSLLRTMVLSCGKDWYTCLGICVQHHNTTIHLGTGMQPSQLHYNCVQPMCTYMSNFEDTAVPVVFDKEVKPSTQKYFERQEKLLNTIKKYNEKVQKILAKRREGKQPYYNKGELVWLRTTDFANTTFQRLQPTKWGPFPILEKQGGQTYLLQLPKGCNVDPVVHVKRLEKYYKLNELKSSPFNVIAAPLEFKSDGSPKRVFSDEITTPQLHTSKIFNKYIVSVTGHTHSTPKNSPPSKYYTCESVLSNANPNKQTFEHIPFEHFCKKGKVHKVLWEYFLRSGPNSLPSTAKCVQMGCNWVHPLFKEVYKR